MRRLPTLLAAALAIAAPAAAQGVRVVKDVPYLTGVSYPEDRDKLDVYVPANAKGAPVLVWYYGGALLAGHKNAESAVGQRFAAAGFVTFVVNYRISPAVMHPAHVQDAAASFAWVKRHAAEYGGNPSSVVLAGHSAGAYLVALLSTDERYLAAHKLKLSDIRGVVPVSAFFYVERAGVAPDRDKSVWGTDPRTWADASPGHHLGRNLPPMLILYADGDESWRRTQNTEMAQAIKAAGNARVDIAQIEHRTHMSICENLPNEGDEAAERIIQFVRRTAGTDHK